jgi:glutamine synthetase
VLRVALGKTAREDYVDYYVKTKQDEWEEWHNEVTPWEIKRYLQLF